MTQAVKYFHIDDAAKDGMLRSKFWTGIRNSSLRNATRYLFDSMKDFQSLFKEIRKIEQEIGQQTKATVPKAAAQHNQAEFIQIRVRILKVLLSKNCAR